MKEIKDFIQELNGCIILSDGGPVVSVNDAIRIVSGGIYCWYELSRP